MLSTEQTTTKTEILKMLKEKKVTKPFKPDHLFGSENCLFFYEILFFSFSVFMRSNKSKYFFRIFVGFAKNSNKPHIHIYKVIKKWVLFWIQLLFIGPLQQEMKKIC